ncbi:MAG: hypothetical protein M1835_004133, partial [Candelina submexicana]
TNSTIATPIPIPHHRLPFHSITFPAPLGATFPTFLAPVAPAGAAQVAVSHENPLGQHPPFALGAQLNQPLAQPPLPACALTPAAADVVVGALETICGADEAELPDGLGEAALAPDNATIVIPLLVKIAVVPSVGQEVMPQSRPTRQQPPR